MTTDQQFCILCCLAINMKPWYKVINIVLFYIMLHVYIKGLPASVESTWGPFALFVCVHDNNYAGGISL